MNGEQNSQDDISIEYRFADFTIKRSQQVLMKGDEKIIISTKPYYLLLTFLESSGKILKKDDVISAVWPGQIVTDTALTKQIVRLRKIIGDDDSQNPMIETHRGVGYRFTVAVEQHSLIEDTPEIHPYSNKTQTISNKWIFAALAVTLMAAIYLFVASESINNSIKKINTKFAGISLAIIPSKNNQDWLNTGGLNYLAQMLDRNSMISSIKPRPEWYKNTETDKLAIEITSQSKINYAFLIDILEKDEQVVANIKLRTQEKIIGSDELIAENITDLLVKVNNWLGKMLMADRKIKDFYQENVISHDNYAMESYLQGVFYQEFNSDQKANDFYQTAVNRDDGFIQAWLQLADTYGRLGNSKRAIAIAENTLNKFQKKLTTKQLIKLNYIIGLSYFFAGDKEKSQHYLSTSIGYIEKTNNPMIKLTALDSLGSLAFMQQDWQKAEKYTLQRIAIAKDFFPFPNYMAAMNLILAEVKGSQGKLVESKAYLYAAINYYERVNDFSGMIRAMVNMNIINLMQNNYDEGISLIQKFEVYLGNLNNPDYAFKFMESSVYLLNLRGYFDKANEYLTKMREITAQSNNPMNVVTIEILNVHKLYVQNKFSQSRNHLKSMAKLFVNEKSLAHVQSLYVLTDLLLSARTETGEIAYEKYNDYLQKYPSLKQTNETELDRVLGHINVKLGNLQEGLRLLESAEKLYRSKNNVSQANYIGFEILEILLKNPEVDYQPTLKRIESYTQYDYLLYKLKAQFLARDENYFDAAVIMSENRQKANQLWDADDQLLLEDYQFKSKTR